MKIQEKTKGIFYIILAGFFFSFMTLFIRLSGDLPTMQKAFFRNFIAAIVAVFVLLKSNDSSIDSDNLQKESFLTKIKNKFYIKKTSWSSLLIRSSCGTAGLICNFYAIDHIGLADSNMLNKLSPFFAIIASYFVLKEVANRVEWLSVIIAFIGALFIIRPSADINAFYGFIGLLGGLGAGVAYSFVRKLGNQGERSPIIVMFFSFFSCIVTLPFLISTYVPMTKIQFMYLILTGVMAAGGQFSITKAYHKAPAKEISVFDYSQILFSACLGMIFLNESPDIFSIIGYIIIIGVAIFKTIYNIKHT